MSDPVYPESSSSHDNLGPRPVDVRDLAPRIKAWGRNLGFAQIAISDIDLAQAEGRYQSWLEKGFHGEMDYMARHGVTRSRPAELVAGTVRVITARMDYLPRSLGDHWVEAGWKRLARTDRANIALYAHGRDYHKVLRQRLEALARLIGTEIGPFGYRVFTDSAPVLEVELAQKSGLGWRGKHTLLLSREAGSMFFLGEIFVDLDLPVDAPVAEHCGSCDACLRVCPTGAIVGPYQLDARRCISYLTIELQGSIPEELRPLIGNRIYGCDDCQLVCPWNKFAQRAELPDFDARGLDGIELVSLLAWTEEEFLRRTEGTAIRRIGHARWLRNVAVAIGNLLAAKSLNKAQRAQACQALQKCSGNPSDIVREHVGWALDRA